jgi:hypothetical protein
MRAPGHLGTAVVVGMSLLAAGCGGGGGDTAAAQPATSPQTSAPATTFVDPLSGGNKWLPLKPGTQWVREGTTLIGKRAVTHKVISTVTDVVREIDGVQAVAVLDEEQGGGNIEKSIDWLAQDAEGNVWWVGAITEQYHGGKSAGIDEAWTAGHGNTTRGVLVPADPSTHPSPWHMATAAGEKPTDAGYLRTQPKECVPFGCYENVVVIAEGLKTDEVEDKYYAAGIGQIRNAPEKSHDEDVEKLANLTTLSPEGLTEVSKDALRIDALAVEDDPKAYGDVKATRKT